MRLEHWPLDRLKPYERKLRKNDKNVERMVQCIEEYGFRIPVLATSSGEIVDGGLRFKAAVKMHLGTIPVVMADGMSEAQIKGFRIMANSSAAWSKWDDEALAQELQELAGMDFDLDLTGLQPSDIDDLLQSLVVQGDDDPDALPSEPDHVCQPGDLWELGDHRLLCGDATNLSDMHALMDGESADMVWTDPPYNVNYKGKAGSIKNDNMKADAFRSFLLAAYECMYAALAAGGAICVAHADTEGVAFRCGMVESGFKLASCLIWRKDHFVLGRADYQCQHEPILYGWKPGAAHRWFGGRKRKTLQELGEFGELTHNDDGSVTLFHGDVGFRVTGKDLVVEEFPSSLIFQRKPASSDLHPTMKPVSLVERFLRNSSRKNDLVLDPFGGSGTTLIASERTGRKCRMMELDPRFADVIIARWQEMTGKSAYLLCHKEVSNG